MAANVPLCPFASRFGLPIVVAVTLAVVVSTAADVPARERSALLELYNSTGGNNWTNNQNWLNGDPCQNNWHGIVCSPPQPDLITVDPGSYDHVYELNLAMNNLVGTLPESFGDLSFLQWVGERQFFASSPVL